MTETIKERPAILAGFETLGEALAGGGPAWLGQRRRDARARFEELGIPTPRDEDWRDTNVARFADTAFVPAPGASVEAAALPKLAADDVTPHRVVLVNGRFDAGLSALGGLPDGVRVESLASALAGGAAGLEDVLGAQADGNRAFTALNTAFAADGVVVHVDEGVELGAPILVLHATAGPDEATAVHPRTLVAAAARSRVTVAEAFVALREGRYLTNAVTEIEVGPGAHAEHVRLQLEGAEAVQIGALHARLQRDARFVSHNFDLGAALSRLDSTATLDGEGAECTLNGLYVTDGKQHVDNHSTLDHARPHCDSRELYKGILADESRAVFRGRIVVRPDAQKTDAKQSNPNLLLSEQALVKTRPQLEIYADDVKCTHGATIGRLDADAQFYLRSRGIGAAEARRMMIHAFALDVLDRLDWPELRCRLEGLIHDKLDRIEAEKR